MLATLLHGTCQAYSVPGVPGSTGGCQLLPPLLTRLRRAGGLQPVLVLLDQGVLLAAPYCSSVQGSCWLGWSCWLCWPVVVVVGRSCCLTDVIGKVWNGCVPDTAIGFCARLQRASWGLLQSPGD